MNIEFIRFDLYGKKVYLEITKSNYSNNLINCYAYVKKQKFKIFNVKQYIIDIDSDLFDKRCNSFLLIYELNNNNKEKKINFLIEDVMKKVNNVRKKEREYKNANIILNNL